CDPAAALSAAALEHLLLHGLSNLNLKVEQVSNRLGIDTIEHRVEEVVGLTFVLDQRILLRIATQPDSFFEVIEREQVVLPLCVDDIQHYVAFKASKRINAHLNFFFGVPLFEQPPASLLRLDWTQLSEVDALVLTVKAKNRSQLILQA